MGKTQAQTTLEYTILIAVIIGALIAMQVYIKRGIQGKLRGDLSQLSDGAFYSPGATNAVYVSRTDLEESAHSFNSISKSASIMNQVTNSVEETLSFSNELLRW